MEHPQTGIPPLPDGSYVRYSENKPFEYLLIIGPDGTAIIATKTEDGGYKITVTDKNGKSVTFTTQYSWDYIVNDLLCSKSKSSLVFVIYDDLFDNYHKTGIKPDDLDPMVGDEEVSVTLLDTDILIQDVYLKTRGTGSPGGCTHHPDMVLSENYIPDMVTVGDPFEVELIIKNAGTVQSTETAIGVHLSKKQTLLRPTEKITPLQPGEEREIVVTLTIPENLDVEGAGIESIILDPDNTEEECNEYNNEESQTIRILPPDIYPEDYLEQTTNLDAGTSSGGSSGGGGGGSFPSDTP